MFLLYGKKFNKFEHTLDRLFGKYLVRLCAPIRVLLVAGASGRFVISNTWRGEGSFVIVVEERLDV